MCDVDDAELHAACRQSFDTLREEFERYKLRAQSVLKSKSSKVSSRQLSVISSTAVLYMQRKGIQAMYLKKSKIRGRNTFPA